MEIDCSFKEKEYYENLKKKFNKKYNKIYKENFAPKPNIGDCSYLYKFLQPTSPKDFFEKYISYYNDEFSFKTHKGSHYFGRSIEQLQFLAECYYNLIKAKDLQTDVTIQECFDDLVNHIILETYDGHIVERYLTSIVSESSEDFIVEPCTGPLDSEIGVDLVIKKHSDPTYIRYIQVKPHSFFYYAKSNKSLIDDRLNAIKKEKILQEKIDENGFIEYVIYNKNRFNEDGTVLIAEKDGKTKFKLSDLIDEHGQPKFDIENDFNYEVPGKQKEDVQQDS